MVRLNKQAAASVGRGNLKQFSGYMLGMTALFGTGAFLLYEFYYKNNKIEKMFHHERTQFGADARHGL